MLFVWRIRPIICKEQIACTLVLVCIGKKTRFVRVFLSLDTVFYRLGYVFLLFWIRDVLNVLLDLLFVFIRQSFYFVR